MTDNRQGNRPYIVCHMMSSVDGRIDCAMNIVCHMMSSVDGRIDCAMTEQLGDTEAYYNALDELKCDANLSGRVTMQMHTAQPGTFKAADPAPIGREAWHKAAIGGKYEVAVDTHGTLLWGDNMAEENLVVITDEACPGEYHDRLTSQGISWIACGKHGINLPRAMQLQHSEFGVERLAVVGGGRINAAFMQAGLLDEVSLIIGGGIDGRSGQPAVFDGIQDAARPVTPLTLESVQRVGENSVWIRYKTK